MSMYQEPIENASGVSASDVPALKVFFNKDSADGKTNVLTDVVAGLKITAANNVKFSQGTHGWIADAASGAMAALTGTLPAIGTKNFVMFGRFYNSAGNLATAAFDYGDYYSSAAYDTSGVFLGAGVASEAFDGTSGWLGFSATEMQALFTSAPVYTAIVCQPATTSSIIAVSETGGADTTPSSTGGTAGSELAAGVGPALNELRLPNVGAGEEWGPYGLLVFDDPVPSYQVIQRGLAWMAANGSEKLPPMWAGMR